jgi:hypothetical protein
VLDPLPYRVGSSRLGPMQQFQPPENGEVPGRSKGFRAAGQQHCASTHRDEGDAARIDWVAACIVWVVWYGLVWVRARLIARGVCIKNGYLAKRYIGPSISLFVAAPIEHTLLGSGTFHRY